MVRRPRWPLLAAALLALGLGPIAFAADTKTSATTPSTTATAASSLWPTDRLTSPDSVDELKALQARVKDVQQKKLPATVALLLSGDEESRGAFSTGSGVIVGDDGLVMTAAHVIVKPFEPVIFVLSDGKKVNGITLGVNPLNDSGLARITDKPPKDFAGAKDGKWPVAELGASDGLKKGQWVVSLGHPGGPKPDRPPPVRVGRFISLDKAGSTPLQRNDLLNTDAALVGGDSGGPLFDLDGKVIGIHSEIGESLDANKHVPVEKFRGEWDRLVRGDIIFTSDRRRDQAVKAAMNVIFDDAAKDSAKIEEAIYDGAAAKAGMLNGDVIRKFNGFAVKTAEDVRNMLPSYKVGQTVKVEIERDGQKIELDLKLAAYDRKKK